MATDPDRIAQLEREVAKAQYALRTRQDYDFRCDECGAPHNLDTSVPSEVWNQIMPNGGALCTLCIDEKMAALNLHAEAEFYFVGKALTSKLYYRDERDTLQAELATVVLAAQSLLDGKVDTLLDRADTLRRTLATLPAAARALLDELARVKGEVTHLKERLDHQPRIFPQGGYLL